MLDRLAEVCGDGDAAARALKLSARAAPAELERNRRIRISPTLPAIERYTGVLFDALGVSDWDDAARERAAQHVAIQSALFGLIGAGDAIPAYRLSHDSRLPGLRLAAHWADPTRAILAGHRGPILDLRSEAYAALGPAPARDDSLFVRVVTVGEDGVSRALSHANKAGKGRFLRAMLTEGPLPPTLDAFIDHAASLGWTLRPGAHGELELVVDHP